MTYDDNAKQYATKKFDNTKKISNNDFETLLKSLQLSASSYGLQPWKFIVIKNEVSSY